MANLASLTARFAVFCIMAMELDAHVALATDMLEAETFYYHMQHAPYEEFVVYPDVAAFRCESCGCPEPVCACPWFVNREYSRLLDMAGDNRRNPFDEADQPDEDRFADYNYDPSEDDDDQEKLEAVWHRRDVAQGYPGGSNERSPGGGGHYWDEY